MQEYELGVNYILSEPKDMKKAIKLLKMSARRGYVNAQFSYALHCHDTQKYEEAFNWFSKAAQQGHADAQHHLGIYYHLGNIEQIQNNDMSFFWFHLAAKQGHVRAYNNVGYFYEFGIGIRQSYEEAVKWYTLSAEEGNPRGQYNLGRCYSKGIGIPQSLELAVKWYALAAQQGHIDATVNLARIQKARCRSAKRLRQ